MAYRCPCEQQRRWYCSGNPKGFGPLYKERGQRPGGFFTMSQWPMANNYSDRYYNVHYFNLKNKV